MTDADDLSRFRTAQDVGGVYEQAIAELRQGRKRSHWMWFVFPQLLGLGRSATSRRYAIRSLEEARAYLGDPVLGGRLRECCTALLDAPASDAVEIFGHTDAMKLRSSMTLFDRAAPAERCFAAVLERFFDGRPDQATLDLL